MHNHWQPLVQLVGRLVLGLAFLSSAAARMRHFADLSTGLSEHGLPAADVWLALWIALAGLGGVLLAAGWWARPGAGLLLLATAMTLIAFPSAEAEETIGLSHHAAQLALIGALGTILAAGPGAWSFDHSAPTVGPQPLGDSNVLA
jgi:uncharacterized membrane protein YphA (DoxX/SURF4 family)